MSKLYEVHSVDGSHYGWMFHCPGCDDTHTLKGWTFNGNREAPTFTPSVLVHGHAATNAVGSTPRCHSFVTDGRIQFLADSTHALLGQTVDLPDFHEHHPTWVDGANGAGPETE